MGGGGGVLSLVLGPLVFPAPVYGDYAYNMASHSSPPPKDRTALDPHSQPKSPYWFFTEVTA